MLTFHIEHTRFIHGPDGHLEKVLDSVDEWYVEQCPGGLLGLQKNGVKKFVSVEDDREFTYKLMKTKIKARDGVAGLYQFIEQNCRTEDLFFCHVTKILDYAFDEMREAKC